MKLSLNSLKGLNARYKVAEGLVEGSIDQLIEKIEAQLGAVERIERLGDKYNEVVIVEVVSLSPHPDAESLNVCLVDDGDKVKHVSRNSDGLVEVVCGAPNVTAGKFYAWLPPGATVPSTLETEPFKLTVKEIRGVSSHGMLASAKELALGDNHDGLMTLDDNLTPGSNFGEVYHLNNDVILDLENKMFTHRPDCFGILGLAREIAGLQSKAFSSPEWYKAKPELNHIGNELPVKVNNELPKLVPRFSLITISDVSVQTSPVWLQLELIKAGIKPINNVVDLTNFFMLVSGQPLHAYDYDKVKALSDQETPIISVRHPKAGEKLGLIGGKVITPNDQDIMIAIDNNLLGLGGVMGGNSTEVDGSTKNLIVESANFDMYTIRRTSMAHGLFTDAVTRFTKGQSPLQTLAVLIKVANEIVEKAGGNLSAPVDNNHISEEVNKRGSLFPPIEVTPDFINLRLGTELDAKAIAKLLTNVECQVDLAGDKLSITSPFWRTDLEISEDIVEEVGRLYGYHQLPLKLPTKDITPAPKNALLETKSQIRSVLSRLGANELLTYSFIDQNLLAQVCQDESKAFELINALSPKLKYYRLSLTPSLLEKVNPNIRAGYSEFILFEIGKTHNIHDKDEDGLPEEAEATALVVAADDKARSGRPGRAYFTAKAYLELLCDQLEFKPLNDNKLELTKPYDKQASALVYIKGSQELLGVVGEFKPSVSSKLKLPTFSAGFEVDVHVLAKYLRTNTYKQLPDYPRLNQDISLKVPSDLSYQKLYELLVEELDKHKPPKTSSSLIPLDIFQKEGDKEHKNVTFRLSIASFERTLTDLEVNLLLEKIAESAKSLGAIRL